jgi:hypothetical protein
MTCSPREERSNEYKKDAIMLYMPHYTLEELVLIGQFALTNTKFEAGFDTGLLSRDAIEKRFDLYGE